MGQYTNLTHSSNDWKLHFHSFPYGESLFVLLVFLYGLKIQLQKPNRQRNVKIIRDLQRKMIHLLNALLHCCAYIRYLGNNHIRKPAKNAKVIPYENKTITKVEKKKRDKHPWDIAQEIILERERAALAVKWAIIPLEVLMDEQQVLHSIEKITDTTPLRDAAKQLPKQIYSIVQSQEQKTRISAELTDQLVFDVAKTYYYSVIQCLCKLIKSIQQGQRTALVSLAKMIQDQRDEIEGYQALSKLPEEMRQLQREMEKLKKHVNIHLERTDKKTSITSVTISEIKSQIHQLQTTIEENFEHIPEPNQPSWVFPGDIVQIHAPENDTLFCEEFEEQVPFNKRQQQEEDSATGGQPQEEQDNTPQRLSPIGQYIPAGAEGGESSPSSSTYDEEETAEEELARFFDNPSYWAANPALLNPIEPEEDWGDTPPGLLPLPIAPGPPPPMSRFEKRQIFTKKKRKEETE